VVDAASPARDAQIAEVERVLREIGADRVPQLVVFNKVDLVTDATALYLRGLAHGAVFASARSGMGIDDLVAEIAARLPSPNVEITLLVPYDRGEVIATLHRLGKVLTTDYEEEGTRVVARVTNAQVSGFAEFAVLAQRGEHA
jgi:GTP-binding protein HflX